MTRLVIPLVIPLLVIPLLVGGLLGCARDKESVEDYRVTLAVKRYNEALPRAYARGSAGFLANVATPAEMGRVDDIIGFLVQGKRVMDARQESFAAQAVRRSLRHDGKTSATLVATEVWWYRHWIPSTKEVKQAPRRVRYRNRYHCVKVKGKWRVDRLVEMGFEKLPLKPTMN
ncbi:MAG: hypothetical protein JRH20_19735 [Deltaproteobacteria bacterium]|nr:hypothetical protein [Deltaproteobacteria bacterium]